SWISLSGGNGVCTAAQCPNYPMSTVGQCLMRWHDKSVYGLYSFRMNEEYCQVYNRAPYLSWFEAWKQQRCFTDGEWKDFCGYLSARAELSAILVYPDIWS